MDQPINTPPQPTPEMSAPQMPAPPIPESMQPPKKTRFTLSVVFVLAAMLALGTVLWALAIRHPKPAQTPTENTVQTTNQTGHMSSPSSGVQPGANSY